MTHEIVWILDDDVVSAEVVCHAETLADCRLTCEQGCESWGGIIRDDDGIWHYDESWSDGDQVSYHRMFDQGHCSVTLFIGYDPSLIPELHAHRDSHEIGRTSITPVWVGEGYDYAVGSECR